jgi:hypothetical protein
VCRDRHGRTYAVTAMAEPTRSGGPRA